MMFLALLGYIDTYNIYVGATILKCRYIQALFIKNIRQSSIINFGTLIKNALLQSESII
jgi:hypothetical protein